MAATGRRKYFVRIPIGAKSNITHPATCLLDTEAEPSQIGKDFKPADWLPQLVESTTKPLYSASKDLLKLLGQRTVYLKIGDKSTATVSQVLDKLAVNVFLGLTFIDQHILVVLPEKQKVHVCDSIPVVIIDQRKIPSNAVQDTKNIE